MVFLLVHDDRLAAKVGLKRWYNSVYGRLGGWLRMHAVTEITINNGASISSLENEKFSLLLDIDKV